MKKTLIFRITAVTLILTHVSTMCFNGVSFAQGKSASASSQTAQPSQSASSAQGAAQKSGGSAASQDVPGPVEFKNSSSTAKSNTKTQAASGTMAMSASAGSSASLVQPTGMSGFNLGVLQSFQNDPFTGRATFSLPIVVPAGRKGIQPSIALSYASGNPNDIVGAGWSLEMGSIERYSKRGVPGPSTSTYAFNSGGSVTELVNIGGSEYRAKTEGQFMRFMNIGNSWLAIDKAGTKYYFGQTMASCQDDSGVVYKWCLDKVAEKNGNYLTVSYIKDQFKVYPSQVLYTGNEVTILSPAFSVDFVYESRPDVQLSYKSGMRICMAKRLCDIKVSAVSVLQRRYHLNYSSSVTNTSLLSSVVQYAADNTSTLPPITFSYQPQSGGWDVTSQQLPTQYGAFDPQSTLLDVNNDGYMDILLANGQDMFLGNKSGGWQETSSWKMPFNMTNGHGDCGWRFADVDGDGWVDLLLHFHSDENTTQPYVYLNNKTNGWVYDAAWSGRVPCDTYFIYNHHVGCPESHEQIGWIAVDINGDGYVDFLRARSDGYGCYLGTGSGWQSDSSYIPPSTADFTDGSTQLADINGDGLLDLVIARGQSTYAYINSGRGWVREVAFDPCFAFSFSDGSAQMADVNGDGLSDIVIANSGMRETIVNQGTYSNPWLVNNSFTLPEGDLSSLQTRLGDTKGRCLQDVLINNGSTNKVYQNRNAVLPSYLTKISNGIGGEISITYAYSTQFDNTNGDGISDIPFSVYVVNTVTVRDNVSAQPDIVTSYQYKNGLFDFATRELRGFGYVKTVDAAGNYSETYFKQDEILKGRPYLAQAKDSNGNLYTKAETTWQYTQPYPGVYFAYAAQTDNYLYDGDASYKKTRATFEYDAYGNPTRVFSEGEVGVTGDEKTQITEYTYNTIDWIVATPKHSYALDNNQAKISEKWFYYDNAASIDTAPTKGQLSKEEVWLRNPLTSAEQRIAATYQYDSYGNLISATDALNRSTTTTYDSTYRIFPVQVSNALSQSVKTVYYGINEPANDAIVGAGLFGQPKSQEDANAVRSYSIYDTFGRVTKVIGPNDTEANPGVSYEYYIPSGDPYTKLFLPEVNYFDGIDDYLSFPDSDDWNFGTGDFTIDLWVKFDGTMLKTQGRFVSQYPDCNNYWQFGYDGRAGGLFITAIVNGSVLIDIETSWTPSVNTWYHIALVRNGTTSTSWKFYVNGAALTMIQNIGYDKPLPDIAAPLLLGSTGNMTQLFLQGWIDDFRISKGIARWTSNFTPPQQGVGIQPLKVTSRVKADYQATPNYLTSYSFYDGLGRLLESKSPAENDPQTGASRQIVSGSVKLDNRGQVTEKYFPYFVSASADFVTPSFATPHSSMTYDPVGRVTQVTNPDGTSSSVSYSDWVVTSIDENSHYKAAYHDAYGRTTKVEEHNSTQTFTTLYDYDAMGNLVKVTDNQNNVTQIWYDSLGRKLKMDDPDMGVWTYEYDVVGNLTKQTDAKGQVLTFTYDVLNRLTKKSRDDGRGAKDEVNYLYDDASKQFCIGRLSKVTDQSGSSEFFYDNLDREVKSIKTISGTAYTVQRSYDALDRLVTLTYPDATVVNYTYNPQGIETVFTQDAQLNKKYYVSNYDYSPTGQIIKVQYGNGAVTNYTYDPNTLRLSHLDTSTASGRIQDLTYRFDNVGNVSSIQDAVNTASQSFIYDDLDRLVQAQGSYGIFNYAYDSIGNMTNKEGVAMSYGKAGKLPHAVTQYGSTAIDYDANGNMSKKGNLALSYDAENRLSQVADTSNSGVQAKVIFLAPGWNFFSMPVVPTDSTIATVLSTIAGKYTQVSRYNAATKAFENYVGNSKFDQFNSFDYGRGYEIYVSDSNGATVTVAGTIPQSASVALKAGANLISCPKVVETAVEDALVPLKLGVDYTKVVHYNKGTSLFEKYDASSHEFATLKPGESYYLYCAADKTWTISNATPTTTFVYDGDGGRVRKTTSLRGANGDEAISTVTYVGSLFEKDTDGTIRKHVFAGANRVATSSLRGGAASEAISYFHGDHLGSSNVITDASGAQVGLTEFTPYGSTSKQTGTYDPEHKFTGKELDPSTGLYFYGARYFDPQLGRFITADSLVQAPYDPQSLNRYSYCRNNPLNYVDPTGHKWKDWWGKIVGAVLGIVATVLTGNFMVGFQTFSFFNSLQNAVSTGNWGGFAGSLAGAALGNMVGVGWAGDIAASLGKSAFTFGGGFLIGAAEMGTAGFGAGFGGALGSGESFGEAMKQGAISGGISAGIGGLIEGSYLSGMQNIAHGMDRNAVGKAAKVERQLSIEIVEKPIPVVSKVVEGDPGMHWGLRINDNYNEFNGTWDFDYVHTLKNSTNMILGKSVPGMAKLTNQAWTNSISMGTDAKYITNVYGNVQTNLGNHYYKLDSYTCHEWVNNRLNLGNDNFSQ